MTDAVRVSVWVRPNARQNEVIAFRDGVLQVRIAAPPLEGKANRALIILLADVLGVSKSSLAIEKGVAGRKKVVSITGCTEDRVVALLQQSVTAKK